MYGTNSGHFVSEGENFRGEYVISRQDDCNNLTSCFRIGYLHIFHRHLRMPDKNINDITGIGIFFSARFLIR